MKPFLFLFAVAFGLSPSTAQITLQNTAPLSVKALLSLQVGPKLAEEFNVGPTFTIYNMDFSVYKVLTVPAPPPGYTWAPLRYITEELFDSDPTTIEFLINGYGSSLDDGVIKVYREDGTEVFSKSPGYIEESLGASTTETSPAIFETPNGAVLLVRTSFGSTREVYSLPGRLPCVSSCEQTAYYANAVGTPEHLNVNGNGTIEVINSSYDATLIQYRLPVGNTVGLLQILDVQGRVIATERVGTSGTYRFAAADRSAGAYRVSIAMNDGPTLTTSFVVIR